MTVAVFAPLKAGYLQVGPQEIATKIIIEYKKKPDALRAFTRASLRVLYGPANDPSTANDLQIGPQMIQRPEMVSSPQMNEMTGLRNLDSGFISSILC